MVTRWKERYDFIEPNRVRERSGRVHGRAHIQQIQREPLVYELVGSGPGGACWRGNCF